jgi:hypothetical protein
MLIFHIRSCVAGLTEPLISFQDMDRSSQITIHTLQAPKNAHPLSWQQATSLLLQMAEELDSLEVPSRLRA